MTDVSVVVPAWDVPELLADALASVAGQVASENVILVDNASTTPLPRSPGVRSVSLTTRVSIGEARNAGLDVVRTRFVVFLDADDLMLPGSISYLLGLIEPCAYTVAAVGPILGWRPDTGHVRSWGFPPPVARRLQTVPLAFAGANTFRNLFPTVGAAVLDVEAVRSAGGFSASNRGEDWGLSAVLAYSGRVRLADRPVLVCRVRDGSLSTRSENLSAILSTRRDVRRRVLRGAAVPIAGKIAAGCALPFHWVSALRRARHRHARFGLPS